MAAAMTTSEEPARLESEEDILTIGTLAPRHTPGLAPSDIDELRIACAQVLPSEQGPRGAGGLDKLQRFAERAAQAGADVVVFPEYFLTGATHEAWKDVRTRSSASRSASAEAREEQTSDFLKTISTVARRNDIDIVAGTIVELGSHHVPHRLDDVKDDGNNNSSNNNNEGPPSAHDDKLFNTAYYVDRHGHVAGRYTKKRLWHPERAVLSPGHELLHHAPPPSTFEITTRRGRTLRAGILICWDLAFPELFREMLFKADDGSTSLQGPDVVFAPICWYATDCGRSGLRWSTTGEASLLDGMCQARAIENECVIAMTNVAGKAPPASQEAWLAWDGDKGDEPWAVGRSCVCAPFVGCMQRVEGTDEALLLANVDLRCLDEARQVYRCRYDLALERDD
ncbi:carbon-nitrogen hydrolase [Acaromyces ingoldii]|uniref:Carbon-nitrogen hydrolase n=1 Tax=Acaromyces ingoldii TaxID=215250 RepID=A0A316YL63_9BASI|nr:carbon-nitrogen hydrolase [Acaromyces ingoldii]PWN90300.1 carbon-nitrogen hydrolase [Acaromyces ingoldii]